MTLALAIILGILQGLTEFLPVSSSGHLALFGHWFGLSEPSLTFDILVHLGTLGAIVIYFRRDLIQIVRLIFRSEAGDIPKHIVWYIILGTIPAGVIGILFKDQVAGFHAHPERVGMLLVLNGIMLLAAMRLTKGETAFKDMSWKMVLLIGCAQALAILPGVSRAGITIVTGLLLGMERMAAARFSFLLAIPAICGAGLLMTLDLIEGGAAMSGDLIFNYSIGFIAALLSGFLALAFLVKLLQDRRFFHFGFYCIALGLVAVLV